ncbi:hypothetical protein FB45DRAFT_1099210 [Roridomyces roridus]|uniref:Uncharacterized protein n=1 Tax=Roridomyces roridus TaxID=1738132 RepID=A0AAD7CEI3_9AGAR|nr:hypothetical protein FB45DRAFT_1099210 [Roridomyces roridus]
MVERRKLCKSRGHQATTMQSVQTRQATRQSRPPPRAYTEQQLVFLRSYLPEFERRTNSNGPRGDAKKFALECAAEFITRFSLPDDVDGKYKEQLYNWFKNTVGRNRRRAEGKPKPASKRPAEKESRPWPDSSVSLPAPLPVDRDYSHPSTSSPTLTSTYSDNLTPSPTVAARIPMQYSLPSTLANALQPSPSPPPIPLIMTPVTVTSLRDSFLANIDAPVLASQIEAFVASNSSPLCLKSVLSALFQAISTEWEKKNTPANPFLTRYLEACTYFTTKIVHAGVSGPLAGARALQMQIRKSAKWIPTSSANLRPNLSSAPRKDHIQWARIHAAAIQVGVFTFGVNGTPGYDYREARIFSNLVAQDAVWEEDEVEWVAGILVLQSLVRTSMRGDMEQRRVYEDLLQNYEERWKEMKDEARQALVTEALLAARADLARTGS